MNLLKLSPEQKYIRRRIIEISYEKNFSHLGSNLTAADIIYAIYKTKDKDEKVILSNGHAGLALYVILEKKGLINGPIIKNLCIHPDRDPDTRIDLSTGSLGHGLPIALGMALADRRKNVYCSSSDGEFAEGSIWEALRVGIDQKISNLKIVINANGWGAYGPISLPLLRNRIRGFGYKVIIVNGHDINELCAALAKKIPNQPVMIIAQTKVEQFPFLKGQDAHYYVMKAEDYKLAMDILK